MSKPWRHQSHLADALRIAGDVRTTSISDIATYTRDWSTRRLLGALLSAAAMVDIERKPSDLLAWDALLNGRCKSGHPYTFETTYVDPSGHKRCRACDRTRRAAISLRTRLADGVLDFGDSA